ncbi:unnamed protein product [Parnassius apollo]|uniref:(apollo) hypothetical protein n=1 Tax=Parnassius apollo TaxID=110799 RepID=A0A8S3XK91_PARAO|nr:unnamed protein product [Parnassius apollo]
MCCCEYVWHARLHVCACAGLWATTSWRSWRGWAARGRCACCTRRATACAGRPPRLALLPRLQALNLAGNLISELTNMSFPPLPVLHTLVLKRNRIAYIDERAFLNTPALRVLRLEDNLLTELPIAVHRLPLLEDLSVARNRVEVVGVGLRACSRLARLDLRANPLSELHPHALMHLSRLTTL